MVCLSFTGRRLNHEWVVRLLRDERERQGLSKYAIEQRAGISQQLVGYIERGLRSPSLETTLRIVDVLGDVIKQAAKSAPKSKAK